MLVGARMTRYGVLTFTYHFSLRFYA